MDVFLRYVELRREAVPDFKQYPFSIPAVRGLERLDFHPEVTFFVGENGSGKSTLIEAIAVAVGFNAEGGSRNFNFATRRSWRRYPFFLETSFSNGGVLIMWNAELGGATRSSNPLFSQREFHQSPGMRSSRSWRIKWLLEGIFANLTALAASRMPPFLKTASTEA